jgi:16S rRNA U1498 N3-methylase RsmE
MMLESAGMTPVTLGQRVLRSEYAVTALLAKLSR